MGNYGFPFPTIVDTFIRALEKAMPESVTGAHFGSYSSVRFIGTYADGKPFPHPSEKAYLLAPAGAEGPGFLMLQNFRVIMKYNPAEAYALAIGYFADRLRGGAPFVQPWPRQERELSRAERLELQQLLAQRGFYRGTPDGQFGGETREALRGFQAAIGVPAVGFASSDVLERLRGR